MTPQHRAAKSPRRNRGWLGVAATAALVATSLGGAAFAATNEQQSDSLSLGSETQLFEENEDFTTEAPEEGVEGTVGSTAPDPVEGEEADSEEAGEGTTEENGDAGGPLIDSSDPSDELDGAMTVQPQAEIGTLAAASVTVRAGGLRTAMNNTPGTNSTTAAPGGNPGSGIGGLQGVTGGLQGVTFQLYSAQSGGTAYAGASCVTGSNGQCTIDFNNSNTVARPWVGISALPAGYTAIDQLFAGQTVFEPYNQENRPYRYQLANVNTDPNQQAPTWNPWANLSGLGADYNTQDKFWTKGYALSPAANRAIMEPLLPRQSSGYMAAVRDNPPLPFASGSGSQLQCAPSVNVGIVMDLSNSTFNVKDKYEQAVNALIDELATDDLGGQRDNVNLGLFSFGTNSPRKGTQNYPNPLNLGTTGNVATAKSRVHGYVDAVTPNTVASGGIPNGATNWDQAMWEVANSSAKYDIVLFITDGDPTTWGNGTSPGIGGGSTWTGSSPFVNVIDPTARNIEFGVYSANLLKEKGTRVTVVGVGDRGQAGMAPMPANLAAISGPTAYAGGNLADADYSTPTWEQLAEELGDWADAVVPKPCDAWVTVQKETKAFDQTAFSPAAGWTFDLTTGTVPNGTTLTPTGTTGQTAGTDGSFTWKYTFPTTDSVASGIKLTETAAPTGDQLDKWKLSRVVCTAEGGALIESTLADLQASIGPDLKVGDHYTCKFSNEQAGVKLNKYWTVNGTDYPVNQMPTALGTTWNATPTLTPAPTKPDIVVAWGKNMGVYKTGDKVQVGETAVTQVATNLPGCQLTKSEIKGPGIGTGTAYVDLPLTSGTGSAEGTLGAGLNVYDLHNVVTCEQELTLIKQVDNVEGGVAEPVSAPGDWTLTAQKGTDAPAISEKPTTAVDAVPAREDSAAAKTQTVKVPVGDYALTEAFGPNATSTADGTAYQQQGQWACTITKTGGTTDTKAMTGTMPAASVNVGIGEHVTCRVVNATAELTVLKKVVGGEAVPSDWTLTATPETAGLAEIEAPGALQPLGTGEGKNTILVKPGEKYTLAEDEGSAAYFQTAFQKYVASESCSLTEINQDNDACWTDANADDVSVAALDRGIYRFVNTYVESPTIPQTGGRSAAMYAAIGGGILILGAAGGAFALRRRNQAA